MQQKQQECDELLIGTDATLYDRYASALFGYIRLHAATREDAEDVTLEVFTIALEKDNLAHLAETDKLVWLRRVAHNKLVDHYRRISHHRVVTFEQLEEPLYDDELLTPEHITLRQEAYTELRHALERLPTLQQKLLHLRYGNGLRFAEIAILLGKREVALRKLLSRALTTLRNVYEHEQGRKTI